ncbi:MAG TPA: hypothetical protein VNJ01_16690 [Bacteriovoracaceae bacterium]|nr:hypothetical protein [Bacteriovoracaceae bacterium]
MKTYLTKLSSSLVVLFVSFPLLAKPVAQVTELSGAVFMISPDGKTTSLKPGEHLEEKSEIMVDEGASITLIDYFDATYHLIGGSHLKFFNKSVQLKRGKTWIKSRTLKHKLALTTANGHVDFSTGEFITSFDQSTARSQILVVSGDVEVSNILDRDLKYTVAAGNFTLVDPDVENGVPRSPTKVGLNSLDTALKEFKQLPVMLKQDEAPSRSMASVGSQEVRVGQIQFITTNRLPASVDNGAHKYFKNFKKLSVKKVEVTTAPIKFYGFTVTDVVAPEIKALPPVETPRQPASIPKAVISTPQNANNALQNNPEFDNSLKTHTIDQPKHSKELDNLIQDLTSF